MGTRNLTMVIDKAGETKVAQYGQWDGYPSCLGANLLSFLKDKETFDLFLANLSKVRFLDHEGRDKEFLEEYDKNAPEWSNNPDNRTPEQKEWFSKYMSRNLSHEVLINIANSTDEDIAIKNYEDFAADSLMNEWTYVIDLSKNTFEVYGGFNHDPLDESERFYGMKKDGEYYPVKHIKTYSLDSLPSEEDLIKDCDPQEEDEE
jgi:hypothetical protein